MKRNPPAESKKTKKKNKKAVTKVTKKAEKKKKKAIKKQTKKLKNQIKKATKAKNAIIEMQSKDGIRWFPSGSVMFNIACTGMHNGAFKEGTMSNIIGDSSSGKSIMVLSGLAWIAIIPKYDKYRLIYDDAEFADSFDHIKLFGPKFTKRVEAPTENGEMSTTIENFYDYVMDACDYAEEHDRPFIYVLDSFDAIDADAEIAKELKNREHRKNKELSKIKGTFGATKQKKASQFFRHIISRLEKTRSVLLIISQTRDNLQAMSFVKQYRSGGRALKFYASIEVWMTYIGAIKQTINKIKYDIGVDTRAKITKNKFTGKKSECDFPIYPDYGIDDVSSCIDFLTKIGYWKKSGNKIKAKELKIKGVKKTIIKHIEKNKKKREIILFKTAASARRGIDKKLALGRLPKYG